MKILRASHLGMCFGVRDAIELAFTEGRAQPLTVLGDLVHNQTVLNSLRSRGIETVQDPSAVRTAAVMITAHGASERALNSLRVPGRQVIEATCPLVRHAHQAVAELVREGYHPVIIGQRNHVEVRGLTEDWPAFDVVLTEEEVRQLTPRARFGVAAQTTQPLERVHRLVACLRASFPEAEVRFVDTVCQPTKLRQAAAVELARQSDVVIVVGGAHSNNTRELVATCRRHCARVYHVQNVADLRREWFGASDTVGFTAGTSTPEPVIDAVENWLREQDRLFQMDRPTTASPVGDEHALACTVA